MSEVFDWNQPCNLFTEPAEMSFDEFEQQVFAIAQQRNQENPDSDVLFEDYFSGKTPQEAFDHWIENGGDGS